MPLYGMTAELIDNWQVLLRVPHLQTEAKLVLATKHVSPGRPIFMIGWQGWNGRRADRSTTLRWIKTMRWGSAEHTTDGVVTQELAEEAFYAELEKGPKRFKPPTEHPNYQTGRFMKWWRVNVAPHDRRVTPLYVERLARLLYRGEKPVVIRPVTRRTHLKQKDRTLCVHQDKKGTISLADAIMWLPLLKNFQSDVRTFCPPEYVGIVLGLVSKHMLLSRRELRKNLTKYGVDVG